MSTEQQQQAPPSPPQQAHNGHADGTAAPPTQHKTESGSASFLRAARAGDLDKVLELLRGGTDINTSNANGLNALHLASKEGHQEVVRELIKRKAQVDAATRKGNTALHIASLAGQSLIVTILVENGANVNVQSVNGFTPLYMAAQENHEDVVRYLLNKGANQALSTEDGFTPLAVALQQGHDRVVAVLLENDTRSKVRLPALHIAAKKDDTKAATLLLQNEHNPDVTSKSDFTPLHIAAHYGHENIAQMLLDKGANVNFQARHNITPLHVAAKWGRTNMTNLLLSRNAKIDACTRDLLTPLHCAARSGHDQVVDVLVVQGAPINAKTKNGLAPLHMAAQGDHVNAAITLVYHRAPVDDVTVDYLTPLHVAAHCGHVKVASMLLERNADPNARALNGFTPLHIACKKNRIKVVELLLKYRAAIEATTESGLTPLHVASFMGAINIVIYLLQQGANPDVETVRGETPLHLAARANQTDVVRVLIRNGAKVDAPARELQTPLHIASRLGNTDIVVLLLQAGANPNAATRDQYTPLHIAAKEGQDEVAAILLDHGADKQLLTKKGFTPLHLASKYGNLDVVRLLLERGTPVDIEGKNQVTPLHVAAHYNNDKVAMLLLENGASAKASAKNGYTPLHIAAKKNQMDIASTLLQYKADPNAKSRAGFTPLHLASQEGHCEISGLLIDNGSDVGAKANNGLTAMHLCAQEDRVPVAQILYDNGAEINSKTNAGYTPLHVACHFGQLNMVKFLVEHGADVGEKTRASYTPLHQAAQQGHNNCVRYLLEHGASPNEQTATGQTPLSIAQRLGYVSVVETLRTVTETTVITETTTQPSDEERYKPQNPEAMNETMFSESEDEGQAAEHEAAAAHAKDFSDNLTQGLQDSTAVHMIHTGEQLLQRSDELESMPATNGVQPASVHKQPQQQQPQPTRQASYAGDNIEELIRKAQANPMQAVNYDNDPSSAYQRHGSDNVPIGNNVTQPSKLQNRNFLISFLVDARGGAMRGCRHSGVRIIVPPRKASQPIRVTCRYLRKDKLAHPPPLSEGEELASRILEMAPAGAKFLGPVILEVPHFASLRDREREIVILRSDDGQHWKEHQLEATEDAVQEVLNESFDAEDLAQLDDLRTPRITRILTNDFPMYFAVVTRVRQEVHCVGPEGGVIVSSVVPRVQAIFPDGSLTKTIKVSVQAQPVPHEMVTRLHGNRVAVSPIVTVEPRRRKFHKPITLCIPLPASNNKAMLTQYSGQQGQEPPTLRLLCSITGGSAPAQWEDITGTTQLTFTGDEVSFTTTVSARFWLMDCQTPRDAARMAQEVYNEAISIPYMAKFAVFARRTFPVEGQLRVFCMTDDKEDKTLEKQEHFQLIAKSRDVEVLKGKHQFLEFAGNLVPMTKSGDQLSLFFLPFQENRLAFMVKTRGGSGDEAATQEGRIAFMSEPKVRAESLPPQQPICTLAITLPEYAGSLQKAKTSKSEGDKEMFEKKYASAIDADLPEFVHPNVLKGVGGDWPRLGRALEVPHRVLQQVRHRYPGNETRNVLKIWIHLKKEEATPEALDSALRQIGRDDIVRSIAHGEPEALINYGATPSSTTPQPSVIQHVKMVEKETTPQPSVIQHVKMVEKETPPPRRISEEQPLDERPEEEEEEERRQVEDEEPVTELRTVVRTERHVRDTENGPRVEERTITTTYEDDVAVNEHVVERYVELNDEEKKKWDELNRLAEQAEKDQLETTADPVCGGVDASGFPIICGVLAAECDHLAAPSQTMSTPIHHVSSTNKFDVESWDGAPVEFAGDDEEHARRFSVYDDETQTVNEEDTPIASSAQFEPRGRSASLAAALLELDPRGVPLVQFFKLAAQQPLIELDESDEHLEPSETEQVLTRLLFALRMTDVDEKRRDALRRLHELEEELRAAGAVTPADPAVVEAVARALAAAAAGCDVQIRVNQSKHTTTTKTVYETETPAMAAMDGEAIRQLQKQIMDDISKEAPHDEPAGTTQKKETAEEGYTNDDGSVVVSKKMTRVVTTTRTTLPGDDGIQQQGAEAEAEAPGDAPLGSIRDRIARFEKLAERDEKRSPTASNVQEEEEEELSPGLEPLEERVSRAELKDVAAYTPQYVAEAFNDAETAMTKQKVEHEPAQAHPMGTAAVVSSQPVGVEYAESVQSMEEVEESKMAEKREQRSPVEVIPTYDESQEKMGKMEDEAKVVPHLPTYDESQADYGQQKEEEESKEASGEDKDTPKEEKLHEEPLIRQEIVETTRIETPHVDYPKEEVETHLAENLDGEEPHREVSESEKTSQDVSETRPSEAYPHEEHEQQEFVETTKIESHDYPESEGESLPVTRTVEHFPSEQEQEPLQHQEIVETSKIETHRVDYPEKSEEGQDRLTRAEPSEHAEEPLKHEEIIETTKIETHHVEYPEHGGDREYPKEEVVERTTIKRELAGHPEEVSDSEMREKPSQDVSETRPLEAYPHEEQEPLKHQEIVETTRIETHHVDYPDNLEDAAEQKEHPDAEYKEEDKHLPEETRFSPAEVDQGHFEEQPSSPSQIQEEPLKHQEIIETTKIETHHVDYPEDQKKDYEEPKTEVYEVVERPTPVDRQEGAPEYRREDLQDYPQEEEEEEGKPGFGEKMGDFAKKAGLITGGIIAAPVGLAALGAKAAYDKMKKEDGEEGDDQEEFKEDYEEHSQRFEQSSEGVGKQDLPQEFVESEPYKQDDYSSIHESPLHKRDVDFASKDLKESDEPLKHEEIVETTTIETHHVEYPGQEIIEKTETHITGYPEGDQGRDETSPSKHLPEAMEEPLKHQEIIETTKIETHHVDYPSQDVKKESEEESLPTTVETTVTRTVEYAPSEEEPLRHQEIVETTKIETHQVDYPEEPDQFAEDDKTPKQEPLEADHEEVADEPSAQEKERTHGDAMEDKGSDEPFNVVETTVTRTVEYPADLDKNEPLQYQEIVETTKVETHHVDYPEHPAREEDNMDYEGSHTSIVETTVTRTVEYVPYEDEKKETEIVDTNEAQQADGPGENEDHASQDLEGELKQKGEEPHEEMTKTESHHIPGTLEEASSNVEDHMKKVDPSEYSEEPLKHEEIIETTKIETHHVDYPEHDTKGYSDEPPRDYEEHSMESETAKVRAQEPEQIMSDSVNEPEDLNKEEEYVRHQEVGSNKVEYPYDEQPEREANAERMKQTEAIDEPLKQREITETIETHHVDYPEMGEAPQSEADLSEHAEEPLKHEEIIETTKIETHHVEYTEHGGDQEYPKEEVVERTTIESHLVGHPEGEEPHGEVSDSEKSEKPSQDVSETRPSEAYPHEEQEPLKHQEIVETTRIETHHVDYPENLEDVVEHKEHPDSQYKEEDNHLPEEAGFSPAAVDQGHLEEQPSSPSQMHEEQLKHQEITETTKIETQHVDYPDDQKKDYEEPKTEVYEVVERHTPVDRQEGAPEYRREDLQDYPQEEEEGKPGFGEKMGDFAKKAGLITGGIIAAPVGLAALGAKAAYDKLKKGDEDEGDDQEEFKGDYEEHSERFEQPSEGVGKQDLPQEFVESEPYKQDDYSSIHESPSHRRDVDDVPKDEMRMVQEEVKDSLESRMSESMYDPEDLKKHESPVHEEESQEESAIHEKISLGQSKDHLTTIPTQRMDDVEAEDYQRHPEDYQKTDSIQEPHEHPEEPTHHEESMRTEEFSTTEPEYQADHGLKTDEPLKHEEIMESTKIETHHVDYPGDQGEQLDSRMTESLYEPEDLKDHSDERADSEKPQESVETETISTTHPEYQQDKDASEHHPVHEEHPTERIHGDHRDQDTEVTDNQFSETTPSEHLTEPMDEPLKHQEIIETTKIETHHVDYPDDQGEQMDSRMTESLYEPDDLKDVKKEFEKESLPTTVETTVTRTVEYAPSEEEQEPLRHQEIVETTKIETHHADYPDLQEHRLEHPEESYDYDQVSEGSVKEEDREYPEFDDQQPKKEPSAPEEEQLSQEMDDEPLKHQEIETNFAESPDDGSTAKHPETSPDESIETTIIETHRVDYSDDLKPDQESDRESARSQVLEDTLNEDFADTSVIETHHVDVAKDQSNEEDDDSSLVTDVITTTTVSYEPADGEGDEPTVVETRTTTTTVTKDYPLEGEDSEHPMREVVETVMTEKREMTLMEDEDGKNEMKVEDDQWQQDQHDQIHEPAVKSPEEPAPESEKPIDSTVEPMVQEVREENVDRAEDKSVEIEAPQQDSSDGGQERAKDEEEMRSLGSTAEQSEHMEPPMPEEPKEPEPETEKPIDSSVKPMVHEVEEEHVARAEDKSVEIEAPTGFDQHDEQSGRSEEIQDQQKSYEVVERDSPLDSPEDVQDYPQEEEEGKPGFGEKMGDFAKKAGLITGGIIAAPVGLAAFGAKAAYDKLKKGDGEEGDDQEEFKRDYEEHSQRFEQPSEGVGKQELPQEFVESEPYKQDDYSSIHESPSHRRDVDDVPKDEMRMVQEEVKDSLESRMSESLYDPEDLKKHESPVHEEDLSEESKDHLTTIPTQRMDDVESDDYQRHPENEQKADSIQKTQEHPEEPTHHEESLRTEEFSTTEPEYQAEREFKTDEPLKHEEIMESTKIETHHVDYPHDLGEQMDSRMTESLYEPEDLKDHSDERADSEKPQDNEESLETESISTTHPEYQQDEDASEHLPVHEEHPIERIHGYPEEEDHRDQDTEVTDNQFSESSPSKHLSESMDEPLKHQEIIETTKIETHHVEYPDDQGEQVDSRMTESLYEPEDLKYQDRAVDTSVQSQTPIESAQSEGQDSLTTADPSEQAEEPLKHEEIIETTKIETHHVEYPEHGGDREHPKEEVVERTTIETHLVGHPEEISESEMSEKPYSEYSQDVSETRPSEAYPHEEQEPLKHQEIVETTRIETHHVDYPDKPEDVAQQKEYPDSEYKKEDKHLPVEARFSPAAVDQGHLEEQPSSPSQMHEEPLKHQEIIETTKIETHHVDYPDDQKKDYEEPKTEVYEVVERHTPVDRQEGAPEYRREDLQDYPQEEEEEGKPGFGEKMGDFAKKAGLITGGIIAAPVGLAALGAKAAYDKLKKGDEDEGDDQEEFKGDYEEHSQRFEQPSEGLGKQELPQEFVESEPYKQDDYSSIQESPSHRRDVDDVPKDEMRMVQEEAKDTLESRMSESMYDPEELKKHESPVHEEESQEESDIHEKISLGESKDHLTTIPTQRMDDVEAEDYQRYPEDEQKADSIQETQEHPEEPTHHEESMRTEEFSTTEPEYQADHGLKTDEPLKHEEIMESTKIETHHVDYPDGLGEHMDSGMTDSLYEPEDLKDHSDERGDSEKAQESLETETISTTHPEYQQDEDASEHLPVHEEHPTEGIHGDHRDRDTEVTDYQFSETSPSEHFPEAMDEPLKHQEIIETTKIETHHVDYPDDQGEQMDSRMAESLYEPEDLKDHSDERTDSEKPQNHEESLETESISTTHPEYHTEDASEHQPLHGEMEEKHAEDEEKKDYKEIQVYPDVQASEDHETLTHQEIIESERIQTTHVDYPEPGSQKESVDDVSSKMSESMYEPEELMKEQEPSSQPEAGDDGSSRMAESMYEPEEMRDQEKPEDDSETTKPEDLDKPSPEDQIPTQDLATEHEEDPTMIKDLPHSPMEEMKDDSHQIVAEESDQEAHLHDAGESLNSEEKAQSDYVPAVADSQQFDSEDGQKSMADSHPSLHEVHADVEHHFEGKPHEQEVHYDPASETTQLSVDSNDYNSTYQMDYGRSEDHHIHEPAVQSPEEPAPESEKPIDSTVEPMVQEVREENVDRAEDKSVEIEAPQEDSSDGGEEPAKDEEEMRSLGSTAEQSEHMEPPMPEEPKEPEPETEKPIDSSVKPMVHEVEEEHVARAEDKSVEIEAPTGFDQHDEQSGRSEEIQDQQKSYEVVERDSPVDSREDVQDYPQEEEEGKPGFGEKMGDFAKKAGLITGGIIAAPVGLAALGAKAAYDKLKKGDGEEGDDQEEFKRDYEEHSQRFEQPSNVTDKQDLPQEFVESEPYKQDEYSSVHESPLHKRDVDDVPKDEMRMVQEEAKDTLESRMSESMYEPEDLKKHESLVHEEESQEESDIHEKISLGESKDHLTTIPTQRMDDVEAEDYQRHPEDEQKADSIQEPQEHPEEPTHHEESLRTEEFSTTEPEYRAEHDFKTDEPLRHEEIMESTKIETHHVDYPDGLGEQMDSRMTESLYEPEDLKDHSDERAQESLETETISTTHPEYQQDEDASEHLPVHEEHPTEGIHEDHRDQDTEVTDNQFSETSPSEHLPEAMEEPLKHQEIIETTKIETHQVDYPDDQGEQLDSRRTESLYEPEDLKDHSDERADSEKPEESLETETFSTTHLEYQDSTVHQPSHEEMSENQEKYSEEYPDEKQERDQVPEKTATPTSDSKEQSQMTESMYEPEEYPGKVQEESKMMESVYEPEELKQVQEGIIGMEERSRESEQDPMTMSIYEQKDDQDSRMSESKEDSNEEMTKSVYEAEGLKDLDESSERTQNDDYSDLPQDAIDSRMTESMYGELKQEGGEDYVIPSDPYHEELMDAGEVPKDEMELIREGLKEEVGVAEDDLQKKAVENAAIEESYHQEEAGGYSDSSKHEEPETHHDQGEKMDSRMTESLYEDHSDERAGSEKPEESLATESISTTHPEYQQHEEPSEPQPLHKGMEEKKGEDHEPLTHQEIIESERIQTAHVDYPEPGSQKDRVDDLSSKMSESMYEPEEKLMKEQEPSSQPEAGDDGSSRMAESMYEPEEMRDQEKPEDDSETTKPEDLEKPSPEDQIPTQHVATEREEASPEDDEEEEEDFNEKDGLLASEAANDDKPTLSEKLGGFMKTAGKVTGGVLAAPVALAAVGAKSAYDAMKQGVDSSPEETTGLLKTPQDEDGERVYYSDESNEDEPQPLAEERDERQIIDDRMDEHHRDIDDDPTMMAAGNVHAEKIEEQHPDERETTQQIEADFAEESGFERIEPPQRDEEKEGFVIESEPYEREEDEERFVEEPAMRRKSEELREHLGSLRTQGEQVAGIVDAVIESQPYDPMEDEMTSAAGLQEAEKPAETEFSMQAEHVREISADSEHLDQDGTRPPLPHHPSEFADLPAYEQSRMEQPLPTSQESLAGSPEERAEEKAAEQVVAEVFDPLEQHLKEYKELGERALGNVARVKYGDDSDEEQPDDGWKVYDKQGELVQEFSTKLADDAIGEVLKSDDSKCLKKQESCQEISMEHEVDYYSDLQEKLKILEEQKGDGDFVRDDDEEAKLHVIHEEDDEATQQIAEELVEEVMTQVLGELNEPNSNYITPSTTMSKDYETCKDTASSFGTASTSMQDSQYSTAQSEQTPQLQSPMEAPAMARIHEDTARSTPDAQLKKLASVDSSASLLAPEMDANRPISPVPPRDAGESFVFVEDRSSPDSVVIREDIEPEMVFVREEEDGELVELPPVEEEEETSSSSGVAGNLAKYRHATSSDNLSLNSLQEFERLEKEIGTRGDGSLTKSELELLACARLSKSGDGSVSSLAEFERLEKELENQSPTEDVMMLSDIREESEAEDMSTRDDDEEEQLLESRPVQEERAQTPTAMLTEDMMITSVDSLEPHNFELVPNVMETSATDSLDPRTDQEDSLIGESERDRDSLDGSFPTTLTTFQTTAIAPDGSVQTISRSVETRMTDPIVSRVLFTGTESQERLDQLPDEQHFETVDSLGNVTKTTYRRQH